MKRNIILLMLTGLLILLFGLGIPFSSRAYTEEEKAQAKAWLSAHGYSPDAGGASQAYQDYLDGKFDEELGITDNTTEEASTEKENGGGDKDAGRPIGAKDPREKKKTDKGKEPAKGSTEASSSEAETSEEQAENPVRQTMEEAVSEDTTVENETEDTVKENKTADGEKTISEEKQEGQTVTVSQSQNGDSHGETGLIIFLSVMLVAIIVGIFMLLK
ncbi:MAG: hypothetical protein NC300_04195 [Bacteroidales bacterium]|nr:hypothetical protein [Clostridium sp.]MCM1203323.1 hypothetical protein [Bacteroidales bacterium]